MQKSFEEIEHLLLECKKNLNNSPLLAEENALKALDLSSKSGFEQGRFDSLFTISCIRNDLNHRERAIKTLEECLRIAKELKDPEREAKALMTLGTVYHGMGIYSLALENYLGAHKIAREDENVELECLADNNAASVFSDLKDYQKALPLLLAACERASAAGEHKALYLRNIANCYMHLNQYDKAYEYCISARNATWRELDDDLRADIYFILSADLLKKDRPFRSDKAFRLGLELSKRYHGQYSAYEGYIDIAETHVTNHEYAKALECLDEALKLGEQNSFHEQGHRIHKLYAEAYRKTGDNDKEKLALQKYMSITEQLLDKENEKRRKYAAFQLTSFGTVKAEHDQKPPEVTDPLTGCQSYSKYESKISQALDAADKHGALLVLDIDNLKLVNHKYGHNAGDKLIIEFAGVLDKVFKSMAVLLRKDEDGFVIFVPRAGREYVDRLIEELFENLTKPKVIGRSLVHLNCSIGIAVAPTDSILPKELESMANVALYQAKRSGKRCFCYYDSLLKKAT